MKRGKVAVIYTQQELDDFAKEIRQYNSEKLSEVMRDENYVENIAKKYLGDEWELVFANENHPSNRSANRVGRPSIVKDPEYMKNYYAAHKEELKAKQVAKRNKLKNNSANE